MLLVRVGHTTHRLSNGELEHFCLNERSAINGAIR